MGSYFGLGTVLSQEGYYNMYRGTIQRVSGNAVDVYKPYICFFGLSNNLFVGIP